MDGGGGGGSKGAPGDHPLLASLRKMEAETSALLQAQEEQEERIKRERRAMDQTLSSHKARLQAEAERMRVEQRDLEKRNADHKTRLTAEEERMKKEAEDLEKRKADHKSKMEVEKATLDQEQRDHEAKMKAEKEKMAKERRDLDWRLIGFRTQLQAEEAAALANHEAERRRVKEEVEQRLEAYRKSEAKKTEERMVEIDEEMEKSMATFLEQQQQKYMAGFRSAPRAGNSSQSQDLNTNINKGPEEEGEVGAKATATKTFVAATDTTKTTKAAATTATATKPFVPTAATKAAAAATTSTATTKTFVATDTATKASTATTTKATIRPAATATATATKAPTATTTATATTASTTTTTATKAPKAPTATSTATKATIPPAATAAATFTKATPTTPTPTANQPTMTTTRTTPIILQKRRLSQSLEVPSQPTAAVPANQIALNGRATPTATASTSSASTGWNMRLRNSSKPPEAEKSKGGNRKKNGRKQKTKKAEVPEEKRVDRYHNRVLVPIKEYKIPEASDSWFRCGYCGGWWPSSDPEDHEAGKTCQKFKAKNTVPPSWVEEEEEERAARQLKAERQRGGGTGAERDQEEEVTVIKDTRGTNNKGTKGPLTAIRDLITITAPPKGPLTPPPNKAVAASASASTSKASPDICSIVTKGPREFMSKGGKKGSTSAGANASKGSKTPASAIKDPTTSASATKAPTPATPASASAAKGLTTPASATKGTASTGSSRSMPVLSPEVEVEPGCSQGSTSSQTSTGSKRKVSEAEAEGERKRVRRTERHCAFCRALTPPERVVLCRGCHKRAYCSQTCSKADYDSPHSGGQGHVDWCGLEVGEEDVDWALVPTSDGKGRRLVALRALPPLYRILVSGVTPTATPKVNWEDFVRIVQRGPTGKFLANACILTPTERQRGEKFAAQVLFSEKPIEKGEEILRYNLPNEFKRFHAEARAKFLKEKGEKKEEGKLAEEEAILKELEEGCPLPSMVEMCEERAVNAAVAADLATKNTPLERRELLGKAVVWLGRRVGFWRKVLHPKDPASQHLLQYRRRLEEAEGTEKKGANRVSV